jgi:hypothetical protein
MTPEEEREVLKHILTGEALTDFKIEMHKDFGNFKTDMQKQFGDFKTDLTKTLWLSQLTMAGILVTIIGIMNGATFFLVNQAVTQAIASLKH